MTRLCLTCDKSSAEQLALDETLLSNSSELTDELLPAGLYSLPPECLVSLTVSPSLELVSSEEDW